MAGKLVNGVNGTAANATYAALPLPFVAVPGGSRVNRTLFASGTFSSAVVTVQGSPDGLAIADGGGDSNAPLNTASRWFTLSSGEGGTISAPNYYNIVSNFRKVRAIVASATSGTTNLVVELV